MWDILKLVAVFIWRRDSETAARIIILVSRWMTAKHTRDMGKYLGRLADDKTAPYDIL